MNQNDKLTHFLTLALQRVSKKEFKKVSDSLIQSLPQVLSVCADLIQNGTPDERKSAMGLYGMFWARLLKDEASRRTLASKRKPKPKVPKADLSDEEFASKLLHIGPETADLHFKQMQAANERWRLKYHGG